jgi:hypothetical protein
MPKQTDKVIEPLDGEFDDVVGAVVGPLGATKKPIENNNLTSLSKALSATPIQGVLFHVEKQVTVQDIEMGVLESGIPYLTGRGLERMCGVGHGPFYRLTSNWNEEKLKPRGVAIQKLLDDSGYAEDQLYIRAELNGLEITAFTEPVCLALLEYYAFISDEPREQATRAFRTLAKTKFREFVYEAVGYSPEQKALDSWKHFHDRVDMTMDAAPLGFFGVFREIAIMIVPMIRAGIIISDRVVPDISVGKAWSAFWEEHKLSQAHGERTRYDHEYPLYYPQAKSNPQPSFAYPDSALGVFRSWLRQHYIASKFPAYLLGQTRKGTVPLLVANKAIEAFGGQQIEYKTPKAKQIK